jgi:hypothetical protein
VREKIRLIGWKQCRIGSPHRKGEFLMRKLAVLGMALLFWAVAASALAGGPLALKDTTWVGALTFVDPNDGSIATDNATLTFTDEDGEFLAGTLSCKTAPCDILPNSVSFSCIRMGNVLEMTAVGYSMSAAMFKGHPVKKGNRHPLQMLIQGSNFQNGDMFRGTLTKQ